MVDTSPISVADAYTKALGNVGKGGGTTVGTDEVATGPSFSELVKDAGKEAVNDGLNAEKVSLQSLTGDSGLAEIVTAVSSAEVTLETVVSVRDRVIQAYQDIIKMPI